MKLNSLGGLLGAIAMLSSVQAEGPAPEQPPEKPFGEKFAKLDEPATGAWWKQGKTKGKRAWLNEVILDVPRDETVGFALYTTADGVMKMTAQMVPLLPDESREVRLELKQTDGSWKEVAKSEVLYPGWSAHFRLEQWDASKSVAYRVRHGEKSMFEGLIRRDPVEKKVIVVGSLSCNSNQNREARSDMVRNLIAQDPDLLFFAGDQSYDHAQHTAAWLLWGKQFREIIKNRPVITIPDDHDIGQGNLWGEGGIKCPASNGNEGGYYYPAEYIRMVERCQTWHLPDPVDPKPVAQGIGVYFTRLRVGGVDFGIVEDRKFKTGPNGPIPQMGPRPDHINDSSYDREAVDVPGLVLLGDRQLKFLNEWSADWRGADMKAVLSQTAFCGAVHLHGNKNNRLLADLDSNAWPQTGRNKALRELRRCRAVHLCGDQHLAVVVQHGIEEFRDGPFAFTSPAIYNNYYGRWWWPEDEKAGGNPSARSPLPWVGDYLDGLGNKITMEAYANPVAASRADGYGVARFDKSKGEITFEAWPRTGDVTAGLKQYPGWPIKLKMEENDGRKPVGEIAVPDVVRKMKRPVISLIDEASGEAVYTQRFREVPKTLPVFATGSYSLRAGNGLAEKVVASGGVNQVTDGRANLLEPSGTFKGASPSLLERSEVGGQVAAHYDGLDFLYRGLWGEHLHHGLWREGVTNRADAGVEMVREIGQRLALRPGSKVCDVGCGYGATGVLLNTELGLEVTGITISAIQAGSAAEGSKILHGDWLENDFADAEFDGVVAIESLEHMADPLRAVKEMARVLKPGGRVAMGCWFRAKKESWAEGRLLIDPVRKCGHLVGMETGDDILSWMRLAGFEDLQFEDLSREVEPSWEDSDGQLRKLLWSEPGLVLKAVRRLLPRPALALSLPRIRLAFRTGVLRYAVLSGSMPK